MNKLIKLSLPIVVFIAGSAFGTTSAHETKTVGSMSVLLHMEPQDSPVIKEPAQLFFAFTDAQNKFDLSSCACHISILDGNKILLEEKLESGEKSYGSNVAIMNFVFPKKGAYRIAVKGEPIANGNFSQFSLAYDVRVERESMTEPPINPVAEKSADISYAIYALGIVGFCAILILGLRKNKNR